MSRGDRKADADAALHDGAGDDDDGPVERCSQEAAAGAEAPPTDKWRHGQEEE
jgi:hypothetical protein